MVLGKVRLLYKSGGKSGTFTGPVIGHPGILTVRYSRRGPSTFRSIGMGDGRLQNNLHHFIPSEDLCELGPGLMFVAGIVRRPGYVTAAANLFLDTAGLFRFPGIATVMRGRASGGQRAQPFGIPKKSFLRFVDSPVNNFTFEVEMELVPDTVPDDACLVADVPQGPLVLLGCCHSGLGNTLFHLRERLGLASVHTIVGGLHLTDASGSALEETVAILHEFDVRRLFVGHCTGNTALSALGTSFSGTTVVTGSGLSIEP